MTSIKIYFMHLKLLNYHTKLERVSQAISMLFSHQYDCSVFDKNKFDASFKDFDWSELRCKSEPLPESIKSLLTSSHHFVFLSELWLYLCQRYTDIEKVEGLDFDAKYEIFTQLKFTSQSVIIFIKIYRNYLSMRRWLSSRIGSQLT